jgi:hypothetical protein
MARIRASRWSDHDRYFGPFTYARDNEHYRPLAIVLGSGDDERPGCDLRISGFGHTLIVALPQVIRPWRRKVVPGWDAATIARLGRDWYWDTHEREYGFTLSDGFLNVLLGRQTHDSRTEQRWGYFLPWTQWRHVRHSFYGLDGEHVATLPDTGKSYLADPGRFERERAVADATPTRSFHFLDFDGEVIVAKTKIEEREWRAGTGWFRWLSLFRSAKVRRSLYIAFSAETGERKGSWKGGTLGHGIDMRPGELHEDAFRRYCAENRMTFIGAAE